MRSLAREVVFKELFAKLFNPDDVEFFAVLLKDDKLTESDKAFANELLKIINQNKDKYLSDIERLSVGYKLARIYNADKCAMLIGMAELENMKDTDVPVIVDEAVKLVSKFSAERSTDFVNGILANYSKEVRNG
jgi:N utilization substance protein B